MTQCIVLLQSWSRQLKVQKSISRLLFDLIIIDGLSILETIFQYILLTLSKLLLPPVVPLSDDNAQQQPFTREGICIIPLSNLLNNPEFVLSTHHFHLTEQHPVDDPVCFNFLNHIRHGERGIDTPISCGMWVSDHT